MIETLAPLPDARKTLKKREMLTIFTRQGFIQRSLICVLHGDNLFCLLHLIMNYRPDYRNRTRNFLPVIDAPLAGYLDGYGFLNLTVYKRRWFWLHGKYRGIYTLRVTLVGYRGQSP